MLTHAVTECYLLISIVGMLGSGHFGTVHKGEWAQASEGGKKIEVAVKTLKEEAGEGDKIKFLQEAAIMGQFFHPNVVRLYGVVTEGEPVMHGVANFSFLMAIQSDNFFLLSLIR